MGKSGRSERYVIIFFLGGFLLTSGLRCFSGSGLIGSADASARTAGEQERLKSGTGRGVEKKEELININLAGEKELRDLPGIGPVLARRIVEYRNEHGIFKRAEEIKNVKGIGDKKFDRMKRLLTIE